jgi:hypothetical protein
LFDYFRSWPPAMPHRSGSVDRGNDTLDFGNIMERERV